MLDWITLTIVARQNRQPRHPLADPLEAEEWRGHQWAANLFTCLLKGKRKGD